MAITYKLKSHSVLLFGSASARTMNYTPFRTPRGPCAARATRGEGHAAPPIRKDPAAALYGFPVGVGRDDVAEGGKERCNPDLLLKHPNTTVATCLKAVDTLETCF